MQVGRVIGMVWATRKEAGLEGHKLMVVQPIDLRDDSEFSVPIVAVDSIGAGVGERVILVSGSVAMSVLGSASDSVIIGIIEGENII